MLARIELILLVFWYFFCKPGEGGLALESFGNAPSDFFKQFSSKVLVGLTEQQGEGDSSE